MSAKCHKWTSHPESRELGRASRAEALIYFSAENGVGARIWLLMLATMGPSRPLSSRTAVQPSRIILECRPPHLAICKRFPWEYVGQLITGFPDESRPEANGMGAVSFPDAKKLVLKAG